MVGSTGENNGKPQLSRIFLALSGLLILIPLSVDGALALEWRNYTIRLTYLGILLVGLHWLATRYRSIPQELDRPEIKAWLGLFGVGLAGTLLSTHPSRSTYFLVWTACTLVGVPIVIRHLHGEWHPWTTRLLAAYLAIQSAIVVSDFALALATHGTLSIGRVHAGFNRFFRPCAFYQEPNYFAAFALLGLLVLSAAKKADPAARRLYTITQRLTVAGIVFSTSRMGWCGLAVLAFAEGALLRKKLLPFAWKPIPTLLAGIALLAGASQIPSFRQTIKGFVSPHEASSLGPRLESARMGLAVFAQAPWVGAGPGAASSFVFARMQDHPRFGDRANFPPETVEYLRNDPLSTNLYTELLSEWGALGTLFFFAGLALILRSGHSEPSMIATWSVILLIYSTTQTLPRADLWVLLSLLVAAHGVGTKPPLSP